MICPNNCRKSFKHKRHLKYINKECGLKLVCAICHKTFSHSFSFKRHVALVHKCITGSMTDPVRGNRGDGF